MVLIAVCILVPLVFIGLLFFIDRGCRLYSFVREAEQYKATDIDFNPWLVRGCMFIGFIIMLAPSVLISFMPSGYLEQLSVGYKLLLSFSAIGVTTFGLHLIWRAIDNEFFKACDNRIKGKLHSNHNSFEQQAKAWRDMWDGN